MKKKIGIIILILIILGLVFGIIYKNNVKENKKESDNLKIVTTFYPIYIMTANIIDGVENVELVNMTDVNVGCLHDYTLSTTDMKKIEKADIIIQNGLGLENFMDKVLQAYSDVKVINTSKNVENIIKEDEDVINGHIWTSISNYILQVEEISNQLSQMNPQNASIYESNKDEYIRKLKELQNRYNTELKKLENKEAICLNEALTYLAEEVKLDAAPVETDHEESTLSAEQMKQLINKMNGENVKIILVDSQDNLKTAETLANETGAKIYKLNSGLNGIMTKDAYINAMSENLEVLKQML